MHPEIQIHKAGNGEALINWYNNGANGQINWGSEGDFDACVAIAGKYLDNPQGFCQLRHIDATGEPAGKAPGEVQKGDVPGHDFHGNQYQKFNAGKWREANNMAKWHSFQSANPRLSNDGRVNEHERAGFWHTQAAQQARLMVNKTHEAQQQQMWTKLAEAHENAAKTHYG